MKQNYRQEKKRKNEDGRESEEREKGRKGGRSSFPIDEEGNYRRPRWIVVEEPETNN